MTRKEFLEKVIRSRQYLMRSNKSKANKALCTEIIKRLKLQMDAYGSKWNSEGWRNFLKRNRSDIEFLIPGNNSRQHQLEILNTLIDE